MGLFCCKNLGLPFCGYNVWTRPFAFGVPKPKNPKKPGFSRVLESRKFDRRLKRRLGQNVLGRHAVRIRPKGHVGNVQQPSRCLDDFKARFAGRERIGQLVGDFNIAAFPQNRFKVLRGFRGTFRLCMNAARTNRNNAAFRPATHATVFGFPQAHISDGSFELDVKVLAFIKAGGRQQRDGLLKFSDHLPIIAQPALVNPSREMQVALLATVAVPFMDSKAPRI